jgi:hypothetical protein
MIRNGSIRHYLAKEKRLYEGAGCDFQVQGKTGEKNGESLERINVLILKGIGFPKLGPRRTE